MAETAQSGHDIGPLSALRTEAERLRLALRSARIFAWDWDICANRIVWADGLAPEMGVGDTGFGGTLSDFFGMVHADDRSRVADCVEAVVEGRAEYDLRFRMVRMDGSVRWTETRGIVVRDPAGRPIRMIGTDRDVTAEMHDSPSPSWRGGAGTVPFAGRVVLEAICDGVELVDLDGRLAWRNLTATEAFGCLRGGEIWREVWPSETRVVVDRSLSAGLDGEFSRFTAARTDANGDENPWDVRVSPLGADPGTTMLMAVLRRVEG